MKLAMRMARRAALLGLVAMFAIVRPAAADEKEDAEVKALVMFIIDVESYKGGFYGVYHYCGPKTHPVIAQQSLDGWNAKNQDLLAAQAAAEQKFFEIARARGVEAAARAKLKENKEKVFAHVATGQFPEQFYKRLYHDEDKERGCAKLLGTMLSESMSFESVAPESYRYWRTHYTK